MSLTNPEKVVTEERLNEYHRAILPYLGGMPDILANKFSRADLYSTDEKMIGRWIDGKPVYQKTINCGALPNATTKTIAHNISNIDSFVKIEGIAQSGPNGAPLPFTTINNLTDQLAIYADATNISVVSGRDRSSYSAYVILQYTKTTDSAVAIGNDTDYSTTEKIVGTWIDGKPIYQKTIQTTMPTVSGGTAQKDISIGATVKRGISCSGFYTSSSGADIQFPTPYDAMANDVPAITRAVVRTNSATTDKNVIRLTTNASNSSGCICYVTIQYTKTTD